MDLRHLERPWEGDDGFSGVAREGREGDKGGLCRRKEDVERPRINPTKRQKNLGVREIEGLKSSPDGEGHQNQRVRPGNFHQRQSKKVERRKKLNGGGNASIPRRKRGEGKGNMKRRKKGREKKHVTKRERPIFRKRGLVNQQRSTRGGGDGQNPGKEGWLGVGSRPLGDQEKKSVMMRRNT